MTNKPMTVKANNGQSHTWKNQNQLSDLIAQIVDAIGNGENPDDYPNPSDLAQYLDE